MTSTLTFELVSPEKLLASKPASMITLPAAEGYIGVLPGHTPLMTTLTPGVVTVQESGTAIDRLFVVSGFVEVMPDRCTILADQAFPVSEIDQGTVEQEIKTLKQGSNDPQTQSGLAIAQAKLEALKLKVS